MDRTTDSIYHKIGWLIRRGQLKERPRVYRRGNKGRKGPAEVAIGDQPQALPILGCRITVTPAGRQSACDSIQSMAHFYRPFTGMVVGVTERWFRVIGCTTLDGQAWPQCWHWSQVTNGEVKLEIHGRRQAG